MRVTKALEEIFECDDSKISATTLQMLTTIKGSKLNVTLRILNSILMYILLSSEFLQKVNDDLAVVVQSIENFVTQQSKSKI